MLNIIGMVFITQGNVYINKYNFLQVYFVNIISNKIQTNNLMTPYRRIFPSSGKNRSHNSIFATYIYIYIILQRTHTQMAASQNRPIVILHDINTGNNIRENISHTHPHPQRLCYNLCDSSLILPKL